MALAPEVERGEWLEEDGLGGRARGLVGGWRTRREQGLLVTAGETQALLMVAGFEAWIETPRGKFAISTHHYAPDVRHPDGATRLAAFDVAPWPRWRFALEDGTQVEQEIFVPAGVSLAALSWRLRGARTGSTMSLRPFLAGRPLDVLHYENHAFRFDPEIVDGRLFWRPYTGCPGIVVSSNGTYSHHPLWYRRFLLADDEEDGRAATEDLASPGVFHFDFLRGEAIWIVATEGAEGDALRASTSAEACIDALRDAERTRRAAAARS